MIGEAAARARGDRPRRIGTSRPHFSRIAARRPTNADLANGSAWYVGTELRSPGFCKDFETPGALFDSRGFAGGVFAGSVVDPEHSRARPCETCIRRGPVCSALAIASDAADGGTERRGAELRRVFSGPECRVLATLTVGVEVLACSGERYARPPGPVPRYEEAPIVAWDAGAAPEEPAAHAWPTARGELATNRMRPSAHPVIPALTERVSDERHNSTNVSDD